METTQIKEQLECEASGHGTTSVTAEECNQEFPHKMMTGPKAALLSATCDSESGNKLKDGKKENNTNGECECERLIYGSPPELALYSFKCILSETQGSLGSGSKPASSESGVDSRDMPIYQAKSKPSPIAKAIVKTHFQAFRGGIFDIRISGPHGLELEKHPGSPRGTILMRVVQPDDFIFAVGGMTFPTTKDFAIALENHPCVISVLRGDKMGSPVEQKEEPDFSNKACERA